MLLLVSRLLIGWIFFLNLIDEDLEKLGLEEFVEYDKQGKPAGIMYDRLIVLLLPTNNKLVEKVGI